MKNNLVYFVLFFSLFFFSCQKENINISLVKEETDKFTFLKKDDTNISIDKANEVANIFKKNEAFYQEKDNLKSTSSYETEEVIIIPDENNEPAIYVVTFNPKGYIIISATSKETPILGYSDDNSFDIDNIPLGMAE